MADSGIKIKLTGFDDLIYNIKKAGGRADTAAEKAVKESANIIDNELKAQMEAAGVKKDLIERMPPPKVEWENTKCTAYTGYDKGPYHPQNPDNAHKAIFLNYGTTVQGTPRIKPKKFIWTAKKKAKPKVNARQKQVLKEILKELNG